VSLKGTGGVLRQEVEDFIVDEVPAYEPCGEGVHTFFAVEKRNLPTMTLVRNVARALHISRRDVGYAGMKDTRAVARQVLSVPDSPPEQVMTLELEQAQVLWAKRHTNKLRTGHLRGNTFTIRIRDVHPEAATRAVPMFAMLKQRGVPNGYGLQRFGRHGDNADVGLLLLRQDREALRAHGIRSLSFRMRRFYINAFQSALFNRYLTRRMQQGTMDDVLVGDIAKKLATGGLFTVEDREAERARVQAWEISPTGPIYGYKMWEAEGEAGVLESAVLEAAGVELEAFRPLKAKGTRRRLRYKPEGLDWHMEEGDLVVSFFAPKGSYATMLLREVMKTEAADIEEEEQDEE